MSTGSVSSDPLNNLTNLYQRPIVIVANRAPTSNDIQPIGTQWSYGANMYESNGAGIWNAISGGTAVISTLTGDTGTATPAAGNIKIAGTANQITTAASGATVTISLPSSITVPGSLATTTTLTAGTGLTVTTGNLVVSAGTGTFAGNIIASKASVGTAVLVQALNSDNTNTASHAQMKITVGGTSGGSPSLLWQVTGGTSNNWSAGADLSNFYRWTLSEGDAIGTSNVVTVDHTTGNFTVVKGGFIVTLGGVQLSAGSLNFGAGASGITYTVKGSSAAAGSAATGTVTLVGGTATVSTTYVTSTSLIKVWRQSTGSTGAAALGSLSVGTITNATSFVVSALNPSNSTALQASDVSVIGWEIVN